MDNDTEGTAPRGRREDGMDIMMEGRGSRREWTLIDSNSIVLVKTDGEEGGRRRESVLLEMVGRWGRGRCCLVPVKLEVVVVVVALVVVVVAGMEV